ncbi:hypothetical protein JCM8547_002857 [Rhodosporidiobolus lusitaniae]
MSTNELRRKLSKTRLSPPSSPTRNNLDIEKERALLAPLFGASAVVDFEEFLDDLPDVVNGLLEQKRNSETGRKEERLPLGGEKHGKTLVVLEKAAVELPRPAQTVSGAPSHSRFLRLLDPDLRPLLRAHDFPVDSASSFQSKHDTHIATEQIILPSDAPLTVDGVTGSLARYSSRDAGTVGEVVWRLSAAGKTNFRVFARRLLLRPVFTRAEVTRGRAKEGVTVRFEYVGGAFESAVRMCEMGFEVEEAK